MAHALRYERTLIPLLGEITVGRSPACSLVIESERVSRRHARFSLGPDGPHVEDLGSVNGTFVRLQAPRRVTIGEEIRVGRQVLRLEPLPRPAAPPDRGVRPWGTRDPGARFRLSQLLDGGGLGEIFPLHDGENVVGREAGDVTFPSDRYVSGRHARLDVRGDEITLADTGSSNGTFVKLAGPAELATARDVAIVEDQRAGHVYDATAVAAQSQAQIHTSRVVVEPRESTGRDICSPIDHQAAEWSGVDVRCVM